MIRVDIIAGARPNFMKAGPIYQELNRRENFIPRFIYTGQHSKEVMSTLNWRHVGLRSPDVVLGKNNDHGLPYVAEMIISYDNNLKIGKPDVIVVVGDTDSSFVGAYVGKRHGVIVAHVEAGLYGDPDEPEELHRRMIDGIADLLLTPDHKATLDLLAHKPKGQVAFVGNTMIDAIIALTQSREWQKYTPFEKVDILITFHRPWNVDNPARMGQIVGALDELSKKYKISFPVHPRSEDKMRRAGINRREYFTRPLEYSHFIRTMSEARLVITDSGGVQPEAAYFCVPCMAVLKYPGWKSLFDAGKVVLCQDPERIAFKAKEMIEAPELVCEIEGFDGKASYNIAEEIEAYMTRPEDSML